MLVCGLAINSWVRELFQKDVAVSTDSDSVQLRLGRTEDAGAVHTLIQPYVERALLLERTVEEIAALTKDSVAAEYRGQLVGFAAVDIYSQKLAEIQCLAVKQEFQDLGVGKQLVARCVEIAKRSSVRELMVISSSDKFLQECGFHYSLPGQKRALFINP